MPDRTGSPPPQVGEDARGILDPGVLQRMVRLERFAPPDELVGLLTNVWTVTWAFPAGVWYEPEVLTHPCVNLSVGYADALLDRPDGTIEAVVTGVQTEVNRRRLVGSGWTTAVMTTPGGFGAWHTDVRSLTATSQPWTSVLSGDPTDSIRSAPDQSARVAALTSALAAALLPDRVEPAREIARIAAVAESRPGMTLAADLADTAGMSLRTLQRTFDSYVGVSPSWLIRRYRLLEVAESVRDGATVDWADLAIRLGYSDQAHLIRDFRSATGRTPQAYAEEQQPPNRSRTS